MILFNGDFMKFLVTLFLVTLSTASFATVDASSNTSHTFSTDEAKPKRPPINDDGPVWPPIP